MAGLAACAGSPPGQAAAADDPRCAIAVAFTRALLENAGERSLVFTAEDVDFPARLDAARWMQTADGTGKPDPALLAKLQAQGNQGAVQRCAALRQLLDSKGIAHGAEATQAVIRETDGRGYGRSLETVSMPVVSEDGKTALIASSSVSGPMAASGTVHMMRKLADGRWETVNSAPLWMS